MSHSGKRTRWHIIRMIAFVIFIASLIYIGYTLYTGYKEQQDYESLQEEIVTLEEVQNAEFTGERDGDAPELPAEFANADRTSIDFEKLKSYNSELVAWVQIPDTNIDYPVARHEGDDQEYYLNYNMYQEPAFSGCIYMEDCNQADFSDYNTVLYGHNMRNGSMFRDLHKFEDTDFFDNHSDIYIYIPGHRLTYTIFAAYSTDSVKLTAAYDFSQKEDYERYLSGIQGVRSMDAMMREEISLTGDDRLLTLSTCIGGQPDRRYVVQGVLTDDRTTE